MSISAISVPQANPGAGYRALRGEIDAAVARVLESGWYILGEEVRAFEAEFAAWLGTTAAVGCGNGTDALALGLRALGVGPGMSVVTVSHTAVATVAAIEMVGATPLLIDIEPDYYTMDPGELAEVLAHPPAGAPPIRAVIPVHLYGQPAAIEPIVAACRRHGVALIEDCAQAHGATIGGRQVGTFSEVATFSFYPTKNLGALGDGGMVATPDAKLGAEIAALRQYGWRQHYISDAVGVNSRLDEMQAAILRVKLRHLDAQNTRRRTIADTYDAALRARFGNGASIVAPAAPSVVMAGKARPSTTFLDTGSKDVDGGIEPRHDDEARARQRAPTGTSLVPPARRDGIGHVFHLYVLRTPERAALQARLREAGIGTGIHYPSPVHLQPAYRGRMALGPSHCRATEIAAEQVLSLPMYPELTDAQVAQVCEALRRL